jgi:spore coat polysaccharide biosynthesis protein SpsF
MLNIHVCLQVSCSSTELPYKYLLPINKLEAIKVLIKRIQSKKYSVNILTSNTKPDDYLCNILKNEKVNIFRGNLNDIYSRFIHFGKKINDEDLIIRITGDNLLVDKYLLNELINFYKKNNYDLLSIDRKKSKLPYGISAELFKYKLLKKWKPITKYQKKYVTSKLISKEKNQGFYIKNNKKKFSNLRFVLSDVKDYFVIKTVFEKTKNIKLNYLKICKILKDIKKKEINNQKIKYSNIILGSAQFDGKYGIANKDKLNEKNLNKIFKFAGEIGIDKIDTAFNYKGVHSRIAKNEFSKKFDIISKGKLNQSKNDSFIDEFNKSLKIFQPNKLKYFLIHNFYDYHGNEKNIYDILKKNKLIKNKIGISIYSPEELKKINSKFFNLIQIPFNLCDFRWKNINSEIKKKIVVRSIFLQGIFFCNDDEIPVKIKPEIKKIKTKIKIFVKKFKRFNSKDLLLNYIKYHDFKGIVVGVDNEIQLKEIFFYLNRPKLKKKQIKEIDQTLNVSLNVIDPRKWY